MSGSVGRELERIAGAGRVHAEAPLAPLTTFRIGGPADWLVELEDPDRIGLLVEFVRGAELPLTVLGGGSNVLVADRGVRGVVLRIHRGGCRRLGAERIRADAGLSLNGLVRWTVRQGLGGLEEWAGTPGCVGGAIRGNAHFRGRLIGERVTGAVLLARSGELSQVAADALELGYDRSRIQRTGEVLLSADFRVAEADPARLREGARGSLVYRKRTQPLALPSAGCAFQNPDVETDRLPEGIPASAGALIDRVGLKGHAIGGARVSAVHANFIVNEGGASAADVAALVELCRQRVADRFGVSLAEEIVRLGESH